MIFQKAAKLLALCLWISSFSFGQATTYTITVVDVGASPVRDAEVFVFERLEDYLIEKTSLKMLCPIQKTDAQGTATLTFSFENGYKVMVVVRKEGFALGWDILPPKYIASPRINIVLEKPVPLPGRVLDHTGKPIAGARVQAVPKTSGLERLEQNPVIGPAEWMEKCTDSEGRFQFDCFAADVSADFHITPAGSETTFIFTPYYLSSCGFETGREEVTLTLPKTAVLKGKVQDGRGRGISGLTVVSRMNHRDDINYLRNTYVSRSTVTDQEGVFCFQDIPACSHFLSIINNDVARPWAGKTVIADAADEAAAGRIVIQLETGGILTVTAVDEQTRRPVQNASIRFWKAPQNDREWFYNNGGSTDAEGKTTLVLPAGKCESGSQAEGYSYNNTYEPPLIEKEKTSHLSIQMTPNVAVSGIVRNADGRPVQGAVASLDWGQKVLTDSDGAFRCVYTDRNSPKGTCMVVRHPETRQAAVKIIENPDEPMTLVLQPARRLAGTVLDVTDRPVAAARVELKFGGPGYMGDLSEEILADKQGRFSFDTIPAELPPDYMLRISVGAVDYGPQPYKRLAISQETATLITLEPIVLKSAGHVVSGTVINKDGSPTAFVPVVVGGNGQPRRTTVTDEKGHFEIRRVCDGPLHLQAGIGGEDFIPGRMNAQGGDTGITIQMGQQREHIPEPPLFDRSLMDWKAIGAAPDVPVLLCFYDYRQRPSRHTVGELANITELTAGKTIKVVLVHVPDIEEEDFKRWHAGRNIPFQIVGFSETFKGRPAQWGVKALPWLILTDFDRKVIAEGFSLSQLTDKLLSIK